jgi:hypothetical protein
VSLSFQSSLEFASLSPGGVGIIVRARANILFADWTKEDTEVPGDNTHLWEESWDDDDTSEDFSAQLK